MKEDNEIDKLFKDNLENASFPDIPQAYLDDINTQLDNQLLPTKMIKTGKGFSSFWIIPISIALGVVYYTLSDHSASTKVASANKNSSTNTIDANQINTALNNSSTNDHTDNNSNYEIDNEDNFVNTITTSSINVSTTEAGEQKNSVGNVVSKEANNLSDNAKADYNNGSDGIKNKGTIASNKISNTSKKGSINKTESLKINERKENISTVRKDITSEETATYEKEKSLPQGNTKKKSLNNKTKTSINNNVTSSQSEVNNKQVAEKNKLPDNASEVNKNKDGSELNAANTSNSHSQKNVKKEMIASASNKKDSLINNIQEISAIAIDKKDTILNKNQQAFPDQKILDSAKVAISDSTANAVSTKDSVKVISKILNPADSLKKDPSNNNKSILFAIGTQNVSSIFESKNPNYDRKRKDEETAIWAFDATFLFNYNRKQFIYSAGLNYSQWGEKINYSPTSNSVKYVSGYDTTYITQQINSNNFVTTTVLDTNYGSKNITNNSVTLHNGINKYSYISIPFLFGYTFGKAAFNITPKIGGMVGVSIGSKGYYISPNLQENVNEKAAQWLVNMQASVDFKYRYFMISPFYRRNIFALVHSDNTTNHYTGLGILFGICIPLN